MPGVSDYNQIKTSHKISLLKETINNRLLISLNGIGTAPLWPKASAVIEFLNKKGRRYREPDLSIYQNRNFVCTFFRKNNDFTY